MLPHPKGEADDIAAAYHECHLGLMRLQPDDFDDDARRSVSTVTMRMDTTGIEDPQGRGTWGIKADKLSVDEKFEFSSAVD
jgi:hypothetical protein